MDTGHTVIYVKLHNINQGSWKWNTWSNYVVLVSSVIHSRYICLPNQLFAIKAVAVFCVLIFWRPLKGILVIIKANWNLSSLHCPLMMWFCTKISKYCAAMFFVKRNDACNNRNGKRPPIPVPVRCTSRENTIAMTLFCSVPITALQPFSWKVRYFIKKYFAASGFPRWPVVDLYLVQLLVIGFQK